MRILDPKVVDAVFRRQLPAFVEKVFTTVVPGEVFHDNWHIRAITYQLERVLAGEITRLIINVPPRYLKSITVSVAFPAFVLGHRPSSKILCVSYNEVLAIKHSTDTRRVLHSPWYRRLFPGVASERDKCTETRLETSQHGFRLATSISGSLTGHGGNLIIIDDPQKANEGEAGRNEVNETYDSTLSSRLNNKATDAVVLVMQRLHENDLTGHLLEQGGWEHLVIPAVAPRDLTYRIGPSETDVYRFRSGSVLDPVREPESVLRDQRRVQGTSKFSAQYLQEPLPAEGSLFHWDWFRAHRVTEKQWGDFEFMFQSWDPASSLSSTASYSVCTSWTVRDGRYYLVDVYRRRCEFPDLVHAALALEARLSPNVVLIEETGIGKPFAQELARKLGYRVQTTKSTVDKQCRAEAVTADLEQGKVFVPAAAPWLDEFRREVIAFPSGRHYDQVDSMVQFLGHAEKLLRFAHRNGSRHARSDSVPGQLQVKVTPIYLRPRPLF